jgi:hypothetical protein
MSVMNRRRFFGGLIGGVAAAVGLKAAGAGLRAEGSIDTSVPVSRLGGPPWAWAPDVAAKLEEVAAMRPQTIRELAATSKSGYAIAKMTPTFVASDGTEYWYRGDGYATRYDAVPPELRDIVKMRDYMNAQIQEYYNTRPPAYYVPARAEVFTRTYPCGCSATGSSYLPASCPDHSTVVRGIVERLKDGERQT